MPSLKLIGYCILAFAGGGLPARAQDFAAVAKTYLPRLQSNLTQNIVGFWYPQTVDKTYGGYILNHGLDGQLKGEGVKMIVTQGRQLWLFSHLARAGFGGKEYLAAADAGFRFLKDKMWDDKNGGFYWKVDMTGNKKLAVKKHLYGQSFGLYGLSEYYLASQNPEALALAVKLFNVLEEKSHDRTYSGYAEWFNEDWTPAAPGEASYMDAVGPEFKLMNTHLHLLEAMTTFYRASRLPLARERLLELITIQSSSVVRKSLGACTDKHQRNWEPALDHDYAKVSYGHDLENIWLLMDACDAAGISNFPLLDLYRQMFDYSLRCGFDEQQGGFFSSGPFNQPANNLDKVWWVEAEALASSLHMYHLTHDPKYLRVFEKTYAWVENHQVDWQRGEWYDTVKPDGTPHGDKAQQWKGGYHNGRALMECIALLKAQE